MEDSLPSEGRPAFFTSCLLVLAASTLLVASTYRLSESPGIWTDEGVYTQLGMNVAQTGHLAIQVAPKEYDYSSYISVGYPLIYPLALSYRLFGVGVVQGRIVMVVFIFLFAFSSYWLIRQLFGPRIGAWSTLILASFPMLYGNGKSVLGEIPGLFFCIVTLVSLFYLEKSKYRDWRWYAATGLVAGICVATKPVFLLIGGALFLTFLVKRKKISLSWSGFLCGVIACMVPVGYWLYTQLGPDVTLRSLLTDYVNPYAGQQGYTLILQNALRFFTETTPLYTALLIGVWAVALLLRRKVKSVSAAELSAFFFCLLIVAAYLRLPGWYRYLFPATITALLFLPSATITVFEFMKKKLSFFKNYTWLPYVALGLLFCAQLHQTAFSSYVAQYYSSTRTHDVMAAFAQELSPSDTVFLYDVPELAVLLPTHNYYQYVQLSSAITLGTDQLPVLQKGIPDLVVTEAGPYTADPASFARYKLFKTVDRYEILKRTP